MFFKCVFFSFSLEVKAQACQSSITLIKSVCLSVNSDFLNGNIYCFIFSPFFNCRFPVVLGEVIFREVSLRKVSLNYLRSSYLLIIFSDSFTYSFVRSVCVSILEQPQNLINLECRL